MTGSLEPESPTTVEFRSLRQEDFPRVAEWLAEPLVARWWNHEYSPEAVERDFGASVDGRDPAEWFVTTVGTRPFGLIQRYPIAAYPEYVEELARVCPVSPEALSVDYLIGDPELRGRGLGSALVAAFVASSWPRFPRADEVIVPVSAANRRSWRTLEHAGFRRIAEGELAPDNPRDSREHYIYRLPRPTSRDPR